MKGGQNQQYFSVNGPKSNALSKETAPAEILDEKIPALVIRKNHKAWNNPFVNVFNPYIEGEDKAISTVTFTEMASNKTAQLINVLHSNDTTNDFIVTTTSENDIINTDDFYQKGLLSITRETANELEFVFAAGVTRYVRKGWEILTVRKPVAISIEKCEQGFEIQNNMPVRISVPINLNPDYVEIYVDGKPNEKRKGIVNRNNPDILDFKFEKAIERAVIVLKR